MISTFDHSFADRIYRTLEGVEYRRVEADDEREAVYRLRYSAYLREGAILPRADERLVDRFDELPGARLFAVFLEGKLAASIRIHVATDDAATPAIDAFPDILTPEFVANKVIVDPNRFVADSWASKACPVIAYVTLRLPFMAALWLKADLVTATVRAEHEAFYRRVLRYERTAPPRGYPTLIKPLGLMMVRFPTEAMKVLERYPFFAGSRGEMEGLFGPRSAARALVLP